MLTQLTRTRIFIHTHTSFMHIQSLTHIYNITHAQTTSYIHTHRQHDTCTDNLMHAQTSYRRTQPFKALALALNLTLSPPLVQPLVPPLVEPLVAPSLGLDTAPCYRSYYNSGGCPVAAVFLYRIAFANRKKQREIVTWATENGNTR